MDAATPLLDPIRYDAPGRLLHTVKLETNWEKECRDAWVNFAAVCMTSQGDYVDQAARLADHLLEEFKNRFEPKVGK